MPHRETRKIIKAGNSSFAVILPRAWLRYYGLTNKDKVKVISNYAVIIEPPEGKKRKKHTSATSLAEKTRTV